MRDSPIGTNTLANIVTMNRNDLYITILKKLKEYLDTEKFLPEQQNISIDEEIALGHYIDAADEMLSSSEVRFNIIIKTLRDGLGDMTEIIESLPVRHIQASSDNKERLLPFCYKCSTLAVMPVKYLISEVENKTGKDLESTCGKILDLIWLEYKDRPSDLKYLWECCRGQHDEDYFLLTTEKDSPESNWRLYAYAYFRFVNENCFKKPSTLTFDRATPFSPNIAYNASNKYEQYFDAYNVMFESKCSDDVFSRYLRMYQMLEYMAYRRILADMTKGNIKENGFVRNVISKTSRGSNNEFEELKKGLKDVIPDLSNIIHQKDITSGMQDFIKCRLMVKNTNHDNAKLWEVVYKLRNGIVHNKESELHFMYANADEYAPGIALMRLLIEKIEPEIVDVINNPGKTKLEFMEQKVSLY